MTTEQQQTDDGKAKEPEAPTENFTVVTSDRMEPEAEEAEAGAEEAKAAEAKETDADEDTIPEGVRKALANARRRAREAEAKARTVEDRLAELEEERKAAEAEAAEDEPEANDFDTYEQYVEAKQEWDAKQKSPRQKAREKAEGDDAGEVIDGIPVKDVQTATRSLYEAVADVDEDFAGQLVAKDNPLGLTITAPMIVAINDADDPAGVMRHLADNPELSEEIAALPPKRLERRLLKLELELARDAVKAAEKSEAAAEKDAKPAAKRGSAAPDPIAPGQGRHQVVRTPVDAIRRGDFKTFERLRNEEEAKRGPGSW